MSENVEHLVLREDADGVATLTLNRPDKRNAVNQDLFRQFRRHVQALEGDQAVGCVVIRGAGTSFCAGHDLSDAPAKDAVGWLRLELATLEKLTKLRQPVIAQVHGGCFTGGLELALSADMIVAGESAEFADTHGRFGLVPGWGLSQRLPRRVGQAKALEMMLTCRRYSAADALAMGLVNQCVSDARLSETVRALAAEIVANSWHSNAANKRLVYETDGMQLDHGIAHELMRNGGLAPDAAQRMAAFAKRQI